MLCHVYDPPFLAVGTAGNDKSPVARAAAFLLFQRFGLLVLSLAEALQRRRLRRHRRHAGFGGGGGRGPLFDDIVGERDELIRNGEAKHLGSLEVDDQIEFGRLLERYVSRLRSAQNLVDQFNSSPE